jgi:hypothetical protein
MAKYRAVKYKTAKYGRYKAVGPALGTTVIYRLRAYGKSPIVTHSMSLAGKYSKFRIKSKDGAWVITQTASINHNPSALRIKAVGVTESGWVLATKAILEEIP